MRARRWPGWRSMEERPYRRGEVAGYWLVVAATGDPAVNRAVYEDGESAGVWVNSADDPASCSFILPAVARQGPVERGHIHVGLQPGPGLLVEGARRRAHGPRSWPNWPNMLAEAYAPS